MLAHEVDGENPAGYSDLLLAAQKLERRAEARDPLPPKTGVTSGTKHNMSSDPRKFIPLFQAEGQPYFLHPCCDCWKCSG